ncbi:MAG: hypothetical protein ACJAQT_004795 [Akkermansiaceae bacterium]|jgi:hypothetical protein
MNLALGKAMSSAFQFQNRLGDLARITKSELTSLSPTQRNHEELVNREEVTLEFGWIGSPVRKERPSALSEHVL